MSIIGKIFGSKKALETTVDGIYHGVDKLAFTEEEKAEWKMKLFKIYEPFKIGQRFLAMIMTIPYVVMLIICALLMLASAFFDPCIIDIPCKSLQLQEVAADIASFANANLFIPVTTILGFYFCGGFAEGMIKARYNK